MSRVKSSSERAARPNGRDEVRALRRQVAQLRRENEVQRRRLEVLVELIAVLRIGFEPAERAWLVNVHRQVGIGWLCWVLGLERSRFFRWRRDRETRRDRAAAEEHLSARIAEIHAGSGGTYGAARVTAALRRQGLVVNRKRVARIMREQGIQGVTRRRRRSLTRPDGKAPPAPDLLQRDFTAPRPGTRLVGDITCVPTREGWVYLAILLDLCTRQIVGWATAARQNAALAIAALRAAVRSGHLAKDAIMHTDRGVQYTCFVYRRELAQIGARQSLSRTGSCLDNAPAESFFASLKSEIGQRYWTTREAAVRALDSWIGTFYNSERLHSAIAYLTPDQAAAR